LEQQQTISTKATDRKPGALTSMLDTSSSTIFTLPCPFDEKSLAKRDATKLSGGMTFPKEYTI
jgi:hypothetical protein